MGGISLAIGLTCVGMGLPMIAAENGFWDPFGVSLLAGGTAMTLAGVCLIWRQSREPHSPSETTVDAQAAAVVGPSIANPQAGRDIHVGDRYHVANQPDPGVPLNRAFANALTELDAIRRRLIEAGRTGRLVQLPAHCHQAAADLMADEGWFDSRRILDEAYNASDNLQHRLEAPHRRWDGGPYPEMIEPTIEADDNLPDVLQRVDDAIAELRRLQMRSPD